MRLVKNLSLSLLAMAFMASVSLAGEITGTVTGKDGKPAADVPVRLMKPAAPAKKTDKAPAAPAADKAADKAADAKPERPKPLQTTKTDDKGAFKFENVEDGTYRVQAGNPTAGVGGKQVKVEGGKAEAVAITLAEPKPKPAK